jgi:hypothetical protein
MKLFLGIVRITHSYHPALLGPSPFPAAGLLGCSRLHLFFATSTHSHRSITVRHYVCTIFNYSYFWNPKETGLVDNSIAARQVATTVVRARNRRDAAARAFVSTIGRAYAKKMRYLNAPQVCINFITDYKAMAKGLPCKVNRLGRCFELSNSCEGWYIRAELHFGVFHLRPFSQTDLLSVDRRILLRQGLWSRSVN